MTISHKFEFSTAKEVGFEEMAALSKNSLGYNYTFWIKKFLDAGIQNVSKSILIVHDLIEISPEDEDGDESD